MLFTSICLINWLPKWVHLIEIFTIFNCQLCIFHPQIYLKLENLQPTGSFKQRGAGNAIQCLSKNQLHHGVYTASAGNFAQGLAMNASQAGVSCSIVAPSSAPKTKVAAIERFGGHVISVTYDKWWQVMQSHQYEDLKAHFIHPVCNRHVIAG